MWCPWTKLLWNTTNSSEEKTGTSLLDLLLFEVRGAGLQRGINASPVVSVKRAYFFLGQVVRLGDLMDKFQLPETQQGYFSLTLPASRLIQQLQNHISVDHLPRVVNIVCMTNVPLLCFEGSKTSLVQELNEVSGIWGQNKQNYLFRGSSLDGFWAKMGGMSIK